ncbi:MAG TPA: Spy/CpxP family protein refolding chaperone [Thermodesulfobacteriota bacterium]|nr:Spy/CpxP family protein refolding chaperone [Thermodesulfobacteriota bacterium]
MKERIITLGLVAVMLLGVTYAYAQGPGFGPGPGAGPGHHPQRGERPCMGSQGPGKALNLTAEQKTNLNELRTKFREENAQLIGAVVTKRIELQSLWSNPKADAKAISDKEKELRDLRNQIMEKGVQMKLEARKFLTPEQIAQFGEHRGWGRGGMMGQGHGMGMGRGMGGMGMWN